MTPMNRTYYARTLQETKKKGRGRETVLIRGLTRYRNTSPPLRNQKRMIKPDIPNKRTHVLYTATTIISHPSQSSNHPKPPKTEQKKNKKKGTHRRFRLAHQSVNTKNTARTMLAILLALVSNPHAMSAAPIKPEPRYPAGSVSHDTPPDIIVAPPSSASYISFISETTGGRVGVWKM
jgi:hypothetical protein